MISDSWVEAEYLGDKMHLAQTVVTVFHVTPRIVLRLNSVGPDEDLCVSVEERSGAKWIRHEERYNALSDLRATFGVRPKGSAYFFVAIKSYTSVSTSTIVYTLNVKTLAIQWVLKDAVNADWSRISHGELTEHSPARWVLGTNSSSYVQRTDRFDLHSGSFVQSKWKPDASPR